LREEKDFFKKKFKRNFIFKYNEKLYLQNGILNK